MENTTLPDRSRKHQRTHGRLLRNARPSCRAVLHIIRAGQESLYGHGTDIFPDRQHHDDHRKGIKLICNGNSRQMLCILPCSRGYRHPARFMGIQMYPGQDIPLCRIFLYRNQRIDNIPYRIKNYRLLPPMKLLRRDVEGTSLSDTGVK